MWQIEKETQPQSYQRPGVPDPEHYLITRRSRLSPSITGGRKPHLWPREFVLVGLTALAVTIPMMVGSASQPRVAVTPVADSGDTKYTAAFPERFNKSINEIYSEVFQVTITVKEGVCRRDLPSQLGKIVGGLSADPLPMPGVFSRVFLEWDQDQVKGIWVSMRSGEDVSYFALYHGGQSLAKVRTEDLAVANQPSMDAADYFSSLGLPLALYKEQPNSAPVLIK